MSRPDKNSSRISLSVKELETCQKPLSSPLEFTGYNCENLTAVKIRMKTEKQWGFFFKKSIKIIFKIKNKY